MVLLFPVDKPLGNIGISINAPVTQERPPTTNILAVVEVEIDNAAFCLMLRSTIEHFTLWATNEP